MANWQDDKRFVDYIHWVFLREGTVYEDVPGDGGGPTKYGIDLSSHKNMTVEDIKNLTADKAASIYYQESWLNIHSDKMPFPIGELMSDIHILGGHAGIWLQSCLNSILNADLVLDGSIGPRTLEAVNGASPLSGISDRVAACLLSKRNAYFEGIVSSRPSQREFLTGWLNRDKWFVQYVTGESARLGFVPHPSDYLNA